MGCTAHEGFFSVKFALTMSYGKFQRVQTGGEYAGRCGNNFQCDPLVSEIATVIKGQGHGSFRIVPVKSRQKSQVDKGLESITNTENKITRIDKFQNFITQIGFHANRLDHPCTVVVPPAETPSKYHDLEIR